MEINILILILKYYCKLWCFFGGDVVAGGDMVLLIWWRCDGSFGGDGVTHWWRCGDSLVKMWWFIGEDMVVHQWRRGGSLVEMWPVVAH